MKNCVEVKFVGWVQQYLIYQNQIEVDQIIKTLGEKQRWIAQIIYDHSRHITIKHFVSNSS